MPYSLVQPTGRCFQIVASTATWFCLEGLSKINQYVENNYETHRSTDCIKITGKQVVFTFMSI